MTVESLASLMAGPIAAAAGAVAGIWIRQSARDAAKNQLVEMLRGELSIFKEAFIKDINGTYRRSGQCQEMMNRSADSMTHLNERINDISQQLSEIRQFTQHMKEDIRSHLFGLEALARAEKRGG